MFPTLPIPNLFGPFFRYTENGGRFAARPVWRWGRAAGLALVLGLAGFGPAAQAKPPTLVAEGEVAVEGGAQAVAINADESILAVYTGQEGGRVVLIDRRTRAPLGQLAAPVGGHPRLAFAPFHDQLLVGGDQALELWDIPLGRLETGKPLPEDHRLWRQSVRHPPLGGLVFDKAAPRVWWGEGAQLYQRPLHAGSPEADSPAYQLEEGQGGLALTAYQGGQVMALHRPEGKTLSLVALSALKPGQPVSQPFKLEGHRFGLVAADSPLDGRLASLDKGSNLILWRPDRTVQRSHILKLEGPPPEGLLALAGPHLLVPVGGGGAAWLVQADDGTARATESIAPPPRSAASPTGKYVASLEGDKLRLFRFTQPLSERAYVQYLRRARAGKMAQSYYQQLDLGLLSKNERAVLEEELYAPPSRRKEAELAAKLDTALGQGDLAEAEKLAGALLALNPANLAAQDALRHLSGNRGDLTLQQARQAYEAGQYRLAISLVTNGISPEDPAYGEAQQLVAQAEKKRDIANTLGQAQEKLDLGLYVPARTLVGEVLRQNPDHPEANRLARQIEAREGGSNQELVTVVLGVMILLGLVAGLLYGLKDRWGGLGQNRPPSRAKGFESVLGAGAAAAAAAKGGGQSGPASLAQWLAGWLERQGKKLEGLLKPRRKKGPPQPKRPLGGQGAPAGPSAAAGSVRRPPPSRQEVETLLRKVEDMVRLARQQDVYREHTAFLLEMEAELNTTTKRLGGQAVDMDGLNRRLEEMVVALRRLRFVAPHQPQQPASTAAEPSYYQLLQVPSSASGAEIKAAYYKLLKQYHPDRHNTSEFDWVRAEAEKMTRLLGDAYNVLSNESKRRQYDETLKKRGRGK